MLEELIREEINLASDYFSGEVCLKLLDGLMQICEDKLIPKGEIVGFCRSLARLLLHVDFGRTFDEFEVEDVLAELSKLKEEGVLVDELFVEIENSCRQKLEDN